MSVCASTPTFTLKMRLQTPLGASFSNHEFKVKWGTTTQTGTTDGSGCINVTGLDGAADGGFLELGETKDGNWKAQLAMLLKRHQDAACVATQELHDDDPNLCELGWRLCNLGWLGYHDRVDFADGAPLSGADAKNVREAVLRYKFRFRIAWNADPRVDRTPADAFYGTTPALPDELLTHVKKDHDG